MARIRTIKPEFWVDEKIVQLTPLARLAFIGLWTFADDEGRMVYSPLKIKNQIFPADSLDMSQILDELRRNSLIVIYEAGDQELVEIRNFRRHQKIDKRTPSKLPGYQQVAVTEGDGPENPPECSQIPPTDQGSRIKEWIREGDQERDSAGALDLDGLSKGLMETWYEVEHFTGTEGVKVAARKALEREKERHPDRTLMQLAEEMKAALEAYLVSSRFRSTKGSRYAWTPKNWFYDGHYNDDPDLWQTECREDDNETRPAEQVDRKYIAGTVEHWLTKDPAEWREWKKRNASQFEGYMSRHPEDFYRFRKANPND